MSFQSSQVKYQSLLQESSAWRLLRSDSAAVLLAFISELFADTTEVDYGRAKAFLKIVLEFCYEQGIWETETTPASYLNQWIRSGWLRELDDKLTKTDACDTALRFVQGLEQPRASTTASHLRIVQEAVRDLAAAIDTNVNVRLSLLQSKKAEIQKEIDSLASGEVVELTVVEQRERIREIYQLASLLTGDFRRVEDEIRAMDQELREQMIAEGNSRGEVLLSLMEKEQLLTETDAGGAFEGFFQLLCDQSRSMEFREQLRSILNQPISQFLTAKQLQYLSQLMRELTKESERVFQVRRRTEEGLRTYIESGAALENRAVYQLLNQLEREAVHLKNSSINTKTELKVCLPTGAVKIRALEAIKLKMPDEVLDTSGVEAEINSNSPSNSVLDCLETVRVKEIALKTKQVLQQYGPLSIANIIKKQPVHSGLEEVIAYFRVAKAVSATKVPGEEVIRISDMNGVKLVATIPKLILTKELFPLNIDDLIL